MKYTLHQACRKGKKTDLLWVCGQTIKTIGKPYITHVWILISGSNVGIHPRSHVGLFDSSDIEGCPYNAPCAPATLKTPPSKSRWVPVVQCSLVAPFCPKVYLTDGYPKLSLESTICSEEEKQISKQFILNWFVFKLILYHIFSVDDSLGCLIFHSIRYILYFTNLIVFDI